MDDEQDHASAPDEHTEPTQDAPADPPATEGRPSRWLALLFVGLLSALVLISTTGIGAAASTLFSGPAGGCGGP